MIEELKKRFATLETVEGSTYLIMGGVLFVAGLLGLVDLVAKVTPLLAIVMISAGVYKIFVKRDK